ncbi:uncharacterized protein [Dermacentor andersoni]|uniref:uncharacterized protein n=1 Tax=Dermacentor andersoni TaxID=34620 RepID=UPI003B3B23F4
MHRKPTCFQEMALEKFAFYPRKVCWIAPTRDTKALLGLDVEQAFENIEHQAILKAISDHNLGTCIYRYVKVFLQDRTATLRIGDHVSESFELGDKGTPQGRCHHLEHRWQRCDAELEARMQEAISVTEAHLTLMGLRCSSRKSELLIYHPTRPGHPSNDWRRHHTPCIELHDRDANRMPTVDKIRILGLIIQSNASN